MKDLSAVERDASEVVQALAGLAALLARRSRRDGDHPDGDRGDEVLRAIAADGGAAAARVLDYLRALRGAGDGAATVTPVHFGPWRDWVPPRGYLLGAPGPPPTDGIPDQRRHDPGE